MKRGYSITSVSTQSNAKILSISSTINFLFMGGRFTNAEQTAYMAFVRNDIESVWNSEANRGLSAPFSNANPRFWLRTNIITRAIRRFPLTIKNGEIVIMVIRATGRAYINQARNPFYPTIVASPGAPVSINPVFNNTMLRTGIFYFNPQFAIDGINITTYTPANNTEFFSYAHEFGHVLGLADRYHSVNEVFNNYGFSTEDAYFGNLFSRPMYLPGYYDPEADAPETTGEALRSLPKYYHGSPHPNPQPNGTNNVFMPQDRYNNVAYDPDYTNRYGWIHNLMSTAMSPNSAQNTRNYTLEPTYNYMYGNAPSLLAPSVPNNAPAAPAAGSINTNLSRSGTTLVASSEKTLIITEKQIHIIADRWLVESHKYASIFEQYGFMQELSEDGNGAPTGNIDFITQNGTFVGLVYPRKMYIEVGYPRKVYEADKDYRLNRNGEQDGTPTFHKSDLESSTLKIVSDEGYVGYIKVASVTNTNGVPVQITTTENHNFTNGDIVYIDEFGTTSIFGGNFTVQTVNATTFQINNIGAGIVNGDGTTLTNITSWTILRINAGLDDVMDYRMSKFDNQGTGADLWWTIVSGRFAEFGFYSLGINNGLGAARPDRRGNPRFTYTIQLLTAGGRDLSRYMQNSIQRLNNGSTYSNRMRRLDNGENSFGFDNLGFFKTSAGRELWNIRTTDELRNTRSIVPNPSPFSRGAWPLRQLIGPFGSLMVVPVLATFPGGLTGADLGQVSTTRFIQSYEYYPPSFNPRMNNQNQNALNWQILGSNLESGKYVLINTGVTGQPVLAHVSSVFYFYLRLEMILANS